MIKHCQEEGSSSDLVTGFLVGLVVGDTLEITNCFPLPKDLDDADEESELNSTSSLCWKCSIRLTFVIHKCNTNVTVVISRDLLSWFALKHAYTHIHTLTEGIQSISYSTLFSRHLIFVFSWILT